MTAGAVTTSTSAEGGSTAAAEPRRHGILVRGLLLVWGIARELVGHVIGEPYREGRLRAKSWPVGLRTIVVLAVAGYALAVLGIVFSGPLRESLELSVTVGSATLSFPRPVLWMLLFLVVFAMALLQAAALHVSWWLAAAITLLTTLTLLFVGAFDTAGLLSPGHLVTVGASLALVVFTVLRRRRRFVWWEFVVVLAVIGIAFAVGVGRAAAQSASAGIDFAPSVLSLTMSSIGQLAVPAAIAAGAAVAELSAATALWTVGLVRRRLPRFALILGLGIVVVWRLWVLVFTAIAGGGPSLLQLATSLALVVVVAGCWYLISRMRPSSAHPPSALRLVDRLGSVSTPIAAGLAATLGPIVIVLLSTQILFAYGVGLDSILGLHLVVGVLSSSTAISVVRLVVGVALVATAVLLARRGRRTTPELVVSIGVVTITVAVSAFLGVGGWLWTSAGLTTVGTIGCFALLAWYGIRRSLTTRRVTGLAVALLLAAFFDQRDFVSDPLGALLGFTGIAFVLFGFVWSFLTSGGYANESSAAFPRPARVLLFLANSVFGVTVLAFTALARNPDASINLGAFAEVGDQLFGTGLMAAALLAVLWAVIDDRAPAIEDRSAPATTQPAGSP